MAGGVDLVAESYLVTDLSKNRIKIGKSLVKAQDISLFTCKRFDIKKLLGYVDWKLIGWVAAIIIAANFARENTEAIKAYLESSGLDINTVSGFTVLSLASFAGAFALGSSSRFGALTVIMASIYVLL